MKILLLGTGMQGKAALHDLMGNPYVKEIVAADRDLSSLREHVAKRGYADKLRCEHLEADEPTYLDHLMRDPDVAIDLLPSQYNGPVAAAALRNRVHLVNANQPTPEIAALAERAADAEVTILPACGMNPGLDQVMLGHAAGMLDDVTDVVLYSGGVPEPKACDNPLKYKITWTLDGVLDSYRQPAHLIRDDRQLAIPAEAIFDAEHMRDVAIGGLPPFEAYPDGDAMAIAERLGLNTRKLINMGCYTLRWPGHCGLWKTFTDLGFLDDAPAQVDGKAVNRRRYLTSVIRPRLALGDRERDLVVVRVEAVGEREGRRVRASLQVIDRRDLDTGFTAMSRTAGFGIAIVAKMVASGEISRRGVLSPLTDVPYEAYVDELAARGISIASEFESLG